MIWTGDSPEDQTLALPITIKWVGLDGEINVLRIKEAAEPVSPRLLLEMICADFLAGANRDNGDPETLVFSMTRFFKFLPSERQRELFEGLSEKTL